MVDPRRAGAARPRHLSATTFLRRSIRAALLSSAGGTAAVVAAAHAAHASSLPPPAPVAAQTANPPAREAAPAAREAAPAARDPAPPAATSTVDASGPAPEAGGSDQRSSAPPTTPGPGSQRRTAGGAIGGVEVLGTTSRPEPPSAAPEVAPSTPAVVSLPGTPPATTSGDPTPARIVDQPASTSPARREQPGGAAQPANVAGNESSNTAVVDQSPEVTVIRQRPVVIVGASGDTTIDASLGGIVATTVTAVASNSSDGGAQVVTAVDSRTVTSVTVSSGGHNSNASAALPPTSAAATGHAPEAAAPARSVVVGNESVNTAVVTESPLVTVVESLPIVLVHPDGRVTIHALIAGAVITRVGAAGINTSGGLASLIGDDHQVVDSTGNGSTNTVVVVQTPTITVRFEIPITILQPRGPVEVHAAIAGVVETQLDAAGVNHSTGTAITGDGAGSRAVAVPDASTNSIVIVQAPVVSLHQAVPVTITDPAGPVTVDALIGSVVSTTLGAAAVNDSSGAVLNGGAALAAGGGSAKATIVQHPTVEVVSHIPVTITDPRGQPRVSAVVADVVRTAVRQVIGAALPPPADPGEARPSGRTGASGAPASAGSARGAGKGGVAGASPAPRLERSAASAVDGRGAQLAAANADSGSAIYAGSGLLSRSSAATAEDRPASPSTGAHAATGRIRRPASLQPGLPLPLWARAMAALAAGSLGGAALLGLARLVAARARGRGRGI